MLTGPSESPGPPEDQKAGWGGGSQTAWPPRRASTPDHPAPQAEPRPPGRALRNAGGGEGAGCPAPPLRPPLPAAGLLVLHHLQRPRGPPPPPGPLAPSPHPRPPGPLGSAVPCGLGATPSPTPAVQNGERTGRPQASSDACTRGKQLALGCRGCPSQQRTGSFSGVWWGGLGGGPRSPQGRVLGEGERGALGWLSPGGDGPLSCPVPGPLPPGEADRVLGRVTTA